MRFKITVLVLANLVAAVIVLWFLDYFRIYKGYSIGMNAIQGVFMKSHDPSRPGDLSLIEREEQDKLVESFNLRESDLKRYEDSIKTREEGLVKDEARLKQERQNIEEQKKKIAANATEAKAYEKKVQELAEKFGSMPPDKAVERILALADDLLILDVLKSMDAAAAAKNTSSVVPFLYSLMPPADASRLLRLSTASE